MVVILYSIWDTPSFKGYVFLDRETGDYNSDYLRNVLSESTVAVDELNISVDNPSGLTDTLRESGEPFKYILKTYIESRFFNLTFEANVPPSTIFNGSVSHDNDYFNFYALTDCDVEGTMTTDSGEVKEVDGQLWFERQWGDFNWSWDWWGGWLSDGSEIEIVTLYDNQDSPLLTYALYVDPKGEYRTVTDIVISKNEHEDLFSGRYATNWSVSSASLELDMTIGIDHIIDMQGFSIAMISGHGTLGGDEITYLLYGEFLVEK